MGETENILQTIKKTVQDIVAPDIRELKVRASSFEDYVKFQFETMQRQSDAQFKALMAAISQSKAESELSTYKQIAAWSERVTALEAHRQ